MAHIVELIGRAAEQIAPFTIRTPLIESSAISKRCGRPVYLKLENFQKTGAFKARGAVNKLLNLPQGCRQVVTASTGNHGLATAYAGSRLGVEVIVYLPHFTDSMKIEKIKGYGAEVRYVEGDSLMAEMTARQVSEEHGIPFVSPYNDLYVIAGQGTIAHELMWQMEGRPIGEVFIAVGGGGLLGGIGSYLKAKSPDTRVIGCWPQNAPSLYASIDAGTIVEVEELPTLSESTAGGTEPGSITLPLCTAAVDERVLITEDEIKEAVAFMLREEGMVIEGAAGVAIAAALKSRGEDPVVVVLCGRNIGLEKVLGCLE